MPVAYAQCPYRTIGESCGPFLGFFAAFGGNDAGNSGEVVGDADVRPVGGVEERLDCGKGAVAGFEDQNAAGFEMGGGLGDEVGVKFVAFFAAEESDGRFVVADFARERRRFAVTDVRRIADNEIEERRLVSLE